MHIGLIQCGGRLPNLALLRLAGYHKARGDEVLLNAGPLDCPDRVYVSVLFTWLRGRAERIAASFAGTDVRLGGTGWDLAARLPTEVEAAPHDYSLYGVDYGLGYTSRGCPRRCGWCPVPQSEGPIHEDRSIASLLNPLSCKLILLDNNFFASEWRPKLAEIRDRGLWVDWPQGNDIRLVTDEIAQLLWDLHQRGQLWGDGFTRRGWLHWAWDQPTTEATTSQVMAGIEHLTRVGFGPSHLRFYVLIGYPGYAVAEEYERLTRLHKRGLEPYVMVYRPYDRVAARDPERLRLAKWNNGHAWRTVPFAAFRPALCGAGARSSRSDGRALAPRERIG